VARPRQGAAAGRAVRRRNGETDPAARPSPSSAARQRSDGGGASSARDRRRPLSPGCRRQGGLRQGGASAGRTTTPSQGAYRRARPCASPSPGFPLGFVGNPALPVSGIDGQRYGFCPRPRGGQGTSSTAEEPEPTWPTSSRNPASGAGTPTASRFVRWTAFSRARTSSSSTPRSVLTAAPASLCARPRPSFATTIFPRSGGTTSP
jgi:hypothetical protein